MKNLLVCGVLALAASTLGAATPGSHMKGAKGLGASQAVTLTAEYDPDFGEYSENSGVMYYKVTLKKGYSYTIWIEGGGAAEMMLDVDTDWDDESAPWASFDYEEYAGGATQAAFLYSDSWDEEDPSKGTYYVCVSGEIGAKTTLYYQAGIRSFVRTGEESSPESITMKDTEQTAKGRNLIEGAYWLKTKLTAGRKYLVRTTGGTEANPLAIDYDDAFSGVELPYPAYDSNTNNWAFYLIPDTTATVKFTVLGDADSGAFKFLYKSIPARKVSDHPFETLSEENSYSLSVVPGRENVSAEVYDNIIDETLCRIKLAKGERWLFETSGATGPILMRVYNSSGSVVGENTTLGYGSLDCRVAVEAAAAGYYYIGVCDPTLDIGMSPVLPAVTLVASRCADYASGDAFDPADDVATGASLIQANPGTVDSRPEYEGSAHGPHVLNGGDWYDCYALPVRKGLTYRLTAALTDEMSGLTLAHKVFSRASDGKETTIATEGSLVNLVSADNGITFTAKANAVYYVRVWVAEGVGLDFPEYTLHAVVSGGTELGLLRVRTMGATGKWYLGTAKEYYPDGATVAVLGEQKITFTAVSGFSTPSAITTNVVATSGAEPTVTEVFAWYNDSYDKYKKTVKNKTVWVSDDNEDGAVTLSYANKVKTASRTLWRTDPADMFAFTAQDGYFYNFRLVDTTQDGVGDQVLTISGSEYAAAPVTSVSRALFSAGKHYLTVAHADDAARQDSSYVLEYSGYNTGKVKFSATTYSVKESTQYATLSVSRTANQGVVRVKYETFAGTAEPGKEYYPTNGILTWKNGDKGTKSIKVRLIPDLTATYEAAKTFTVRLTPMDEDDLADDEFPAILVNDTATVKLTEVSKAAPGTVKPTSYGAEETAFAKPTKPAFTVRAGDDADLTISRTGGANGKVAVRVQALTDKKRQDSPDTATAGTDYEPFSEILEWEDGEDGDKTVTVLTHASTTLAAKRQFTVRLTALTSGDYKGWAKPTVKPSEVIVTIANDTLVKTMSTCAKEAKSDGIKLSGTGTWFRDTDGAFRSAAKAGTANATFEVTGPGVFVADARVVDGACDDTLTCKVGAAEAFACDGRFARVVPSGKQKIVFAFTGTGSEGYACLDELDNAKPYKWVPFSRFVPFEPANKAAVPTSGVSRLAWTLPDDLEYEDVDFRVKAGSSAKAMTTLLTNATTTVCTLEPEDYEFQPGKTTYWSLEVADGTGVWRGGAPTWQFSTVVEGAVATGIAGVDSFGNPFDELVAANEKIELVQGVKVSFEIGPKLAASVTNRVASGSLPSGLKLDVRGGKGTVTGVPTKAGVYTAVLQTATGTKKQPIWSESVTLRFNVAPLGTAAGTYRGALAEDGSALTRGAPKAGFLTWTSTTAGKLSAKVLLAGKTYAFSGTGFDEVVARDDGALGCDKELSATLTCSVKTKSGSKVTGTYTSELTVTLFDGAATNLTALSESQGRVALHMFVLSSDGKSVEETDYVCTLYRSNAGSADYLKLIKPFVGYYTLALAPLGVSSAEDGVPAGNGFLAVTIDSKGVAKITGRLADGTSVSTSSHGTLIGDYESSAEAGVVEIPFCHSAAKASAGGILRIAYSSDDDDQPASVFDATEMILWYKDGANATASGENLELSLSPAGGWYDKLVNLQRYYLDYDFTLDGTPVILYGNAVKLGSTKGESVSAMTYTLTRATGLVSGTLTYEKTKKIKHYGVLTFNRDEASLLDPEVWTAGFFLHKVNSSWTESLPFNILGVQVDRDWSEADAPVVE